MSKEEYISKVEFTILYVALGFVLLFQYSRALKYEELFLFLELMMSYVWTGGLLVYAKIRFNLKIFEPISIITVIYEGIFIIKPIIDLRNHEMNEHGISVIGGGPKATLFFVIGYTVFFFSYYLTHKKITYNSHPLIKEMDTESEFTGNKLVVLYLSWIVVFALCIYCMVTQGLTLKYIFSFGAEGLRSVDDSNTALLFLSNFGVTLVTLWVMILEYSRNILIKVITTTLGIVYILMRNARWLMLVFILAPIILFYLKRNKEPKIYWVLIVGLAGLTVFAWMQANRATLASGGAMQGWGAEGFSLEALLAPLESDLSTYRTFYSMVTRFPTQYDFMLGITFAYVFVLFIPRALWAGKPDNPVRDMIEHSLNENARDSGTAVANIGECYANFGILGICVYMYVFGWIAASLKRYVFRPNYDSIKIRNRQIIYSILYPLFFQWIARGNFSGNFYLTIFALLPVLVPQVLKIIWKQKR